MNRLEKILVMVAMAFLILVIFFIFAKADESKQEYAPTEVQTLRLQVKQRDAQLAQKDLFTAQLNFQVAVTMLETEGDKVKRENQWPVTVKFDKDKLTFSESPILDLSKSQGELSHPARSK